MSDPLTTPDSQAQPDSQPPTGEPQEIDEVKALRKEAAAYRTKLREAEKALEAQKTAQEAATQQELAEQGKWKEIAEKNALKLAEFEKFKTQAEQYEGVLTNLVKSQREGLPDYITDLLDKMPAIDQLEWIAAHKAELSQPAQPGQPKPQTFNPVGQPGSAESDAQRLQRLRKAAGQGMTPFDSRK